MSSAAHHVMAYRTSAGEEVSDDDGESGAGRRLLTLLQRMGVEDVVVVATRWYGGVHLGPARFRHLVRVAKEAVELLSPRRK